MRPVICIDEFENFFANSEEFDVRFFNGLRYISGNLRAAAWITASRIPLRDLFAGEALTSDLPTVFTQLKLGNFTPLEADTLLKKGPFTPDERQRLLVLATRHPGRLQLAAMLYFDERKQPLVDWDQFKQKYEEKSAAAFAPKKRSFSLGRLPLRQVIHIPYCLGKIAQAVGNEYDKLGAWIIGGIIVIVVILVILGRLDVQAVLNRLGQ